jgi:hypothetical protein
MKKKSDEVYKEYILLIAIHGRKVGSNPIETDDIIIDSRSVTWLNADTVFTSQFGRLLCSNRSSLSRQILEEKSS